MFSLIIIKQLCIGLTPRISIASESWLKLCLPLESYSLPSFHLFRNDRRWVVVGVWPYILEHIFLMQSQLSRHNYRFQMLGSIFSWKLSFIITKSFQVHINVLLSASTFSLPQKIFSNPLLLNTVILFSWETLILVLK